MNMQERKSIVMKNKMQQKKSFKWFLDNVSDLAQKHPEKFLAIKNCKVLGVYNSFMEALQKTQKAGHELGSFLVQQASVDPAAYTVTHYNSFLGVV